MKIETPWGKIIATSLFLAAVGVWLPFLHLYLVNAANLTLPLAVHLPRLAVLGGAVAALALGLQLAAPRRARRAVGAGLLVVGVLMWAESTLFIGDFGFLAGGDLDWEANRHLPYLEGGLAVLLLAALVRLRRFLARRAGLIMLVLLVSASANLVGPLQAELKRTKQGAKHTFTEEGIFDLSSERNVLVFILDTFQSDLFAEIVAGNPHWREALDGFTYFPDATSAFPKTYASVPSILTGRAFDNSEPFPTFLREAYLGDSAPRVLKSHGFDVRYRSFTWQPYFAHPDVADNLAALGSGGRADWMRQKESVQLENLLLFRLAPFAAKRWVFNDNQFRLQVPPAPEDRPGDRYALADAQRVYSAGNKVEDLVFLDRMLAFLNTGCERPAFRVFHLLGTHAPFQLDPDLRFVGRGDLERGPYLDQGAAMLRLMELVFDRLRDLGAYDNSLILVLGDHGNGELTGLDIRPEALAALGGETGIGRCDDPRLLEVMRGGTPLLLAKEPDSRGPLRLSGAPVELADIPATIFGTLGLRAGTSGRSLFSPDFDPDRVRLHRFYRFAGWGQDFIVPMTEYQVTGFSWDPASWSPTGRNLNQAAVAAAGGCMVVLGEGGNLEDFPHAGWSAPRIQGRAIANRSATVGIPLPADLDQTSLKLVLRNLPPQPPAPLKVYAGGVLVGVVTVGGESPNTHKIFLPKKILVPESVLELRFELDPGMNPGPQLVEIFLDYQAERAVFPLGRKVSFGLGGRPARYLDYGWDRSENWGTWTLGQQSLMFLSLGRPPRTDLILSTHLSAAVFGSSPPLRARILANGTVIGRLEIRAGHPDQHRFRIPVDLVGASGDLDLAILVDNPRSPNQYGLGPDNRLLGLGLHWLKIDEAPADGPAPLPATPQVLTPGTATPAGISPYGWENWGGRAAAWTSGTARFRWPLGNAPQPRRIAVTALAGAPRTPYCLALVNGVVAGAGPLSAFPWQGFISLDGVPQRDQVQLTLHSTSFCPSTDGSGADDRRLGLALAAVAPQEGPAPAPADSAAATTLPRPHHQVLHPTGGPGSWTGLNESETWDGEPVTWTDGQAVCRFDWNRAEPPRYLLVDLAGTPAGESPLVVTLGGCRVLEEKTRGGSWARLVALPPGLPTGPLELTIASGAFRPREGEGDDDSRVLGVALRSLIVLE